MTKTAIEIHAALGELADRLERLGRRVNKAAIVDDHQKANLAAGLIAEGELLRLLVAGEG